MNEEISNQENVSNPILSTHIRKRRLQWYDHVCQREKYEDIRLVVNLKVTSKKKRYTQSMMERYHKLRHIMVRYIASRTEPGARTGIWVRNLRNSMNNCKLSSLTM